MSKRAASAYRKADRHSGRLFAEVMARGPAPSAPKSEAAPMPAIFARRPLLVPHQPGLGPFWPDVTLLQEQAQPMTAATAEGSVAAVV